MNVAFLGSTTSTMWYLHEGTVIVIVFIIAAIFGCGIISILENKKIIGDKK